MRPDLLAVTSFSPKGYEVYGRKCLETFVQYWPCQLVVWFEERPDFNHEKIIYRDIAEVSNLTSFLKKISGISDTDGMVNGGYDYRLDARKFCKKTFVQDASFDLAEKVFWLDADSITLREIPASFLGGLVQDFPFAYLGRKKTYTETGFLGFNTSHPEFQKFRSGYVESYTSGRIFGEKEWHDCIAFDIARDGIKGNDLNANGPQGMDHVFPHTILAPYIEHRKGPRRKLEAYGRI